MKQSAAFFQKECMELLRSGKFFILLIISGIYGVMNPAIAKLTPWIMEQSAADLADSGIVIGKINIDAMTSWEQYYKNTMIPIFVFLVLFSGILTAEYQGKTLINMVTKGLSRWKIIFSKTTLLVLAWTFAYWCAFGITYGYNAYYWDNGIASHVGFAGSCIYVLGLWIISLIILMSVISTSNVGVLIGSAVVYGVCYFGGTIVEWEEFLPTHLLKAGELLNGLAKVEDYYGAILVCGIWAIVNLIGSVILFNRKSL